MSALDPRRETRESLSDFRRLGGDGCRQSRESGRRAPVARRLLCLPRMARQDNTAMWFERGENEASLAEIPSVAEDGDGDSRRSVPTLAWIGGGVAVLLVSFCELLTHAAHASRVSSLPSLTIAGPTQQTSQPEPTQTATQLASAPLQPQPNAATATQSSATMTRPSAPLQLQSSTTTMPVRPTAAPGARSATRSANARVSRRSAKARVVARVAKISPDVVAGEKLLRQGRAALALTKFQQQIGRSLDDARALRGACLAIADLGRLNEAARVCRRALDVAPEDLTTRRSLATIYYNGGAYKWSATEWRHVVEQAPKDQHAKKALRAAEARS